MYKYITHHHVLQNIYRTSNVMQLPYEDSEHQQIMFSCYVPYQLIIDEVALKDINGHCIQYVSTQSMSTMSKYVK